MQRYGFSYFLYYAAITVPQIIVTNTEREMTKRVILINAFFIIFNLFVLQSNNYLLFFDMQIKRVFIYKQRKTENIYRKTIKTIRFSIYKV